jgi:tryptophan synthase alpha chain
MSRIAARFATLAQQHRKGLIPYVCAGDPSPQATVPILHALARAGADVIELGVPFSDPMADGPVIQRAAERAIRNGVGLARTLELVREFRVGDAATPIVLMGYGNPIERMGLDRFVAAAAAAGVDGVLVVDYPPEESRAFAAALKAVRIDPIYLLAPTSDDARVAQVGAAASGYVYYVSLKGITGAGHLDIADVTARLPALRARIGVPIGVGFGIRDAASAAAVARVADAVVVGSRIIQEIENHPPQQAAAAVERLVGELRAAIDTATRDPASFGGGGA